jgi:hypothetical protein
MAAVFVANEESTYPILVGFKYRPIFIAMHQTSLRGRDILLGNMVFVAMRMIVTVSIYFFIIVLFGGVQLATAPLAILVAAMTGLAVAATGQRLCGDHHGGPGSTADAVSVGVYAAVFVLWNVFPARDFAYGVFKSLAGCHLCGTGHSGGVFSPTASSSRGG